MFTPSGRRPRRPLAGGRLTALAKACKTSSQQRVLRRAVFPVSKTGLHCSPSARGLPVGFPPAVFPVSKTGLHCSDRLRLGDQHWHLVFPVSKTGLHCSERALQRLLSVDHVFPVSKTGLHCSQIRGADPRSRSRSYSRSLRPGSIAATALRSDAGARRHGIPGL